MDLGQRMLGSDAGESVFARCRDLSVTRTREAFIRGLCSRVSV
jgi:hypothetical protein